MRIAWMMGWATPRVWFAPLVESYFPADDHVFIDAGPDAWDQLERSGKFDALVGYSLGSLLLLENPERASHLAPRVILLSPIFAFPKEAGLGGKVARAQVLYLTKWLRRDPAAALADFSLRAGLDLPSQPLSEAALVRLEWGLKRLEVGRVNPPVPLGWSLYCGSGDALLDCEALAKVEPGLTVIFGATHHPALLVRAFAAAIPSVVAGVADPGFACSKEASPGVGDPSYNNRAGREARPETRTK